MKVGDLVRHGPMTEQPISTPVPKWVGEIGIILEIRNTQEDHPDYRTEDAVLVMWAAGHDWSWRSELERTNESR